MDKLSWIDANGTEHLFTSDLVVLQGKQGFHMPPIAHVEENVPFQFGTKRRETRIEAREIDVPLLIRSDSPVTLRQKVRECLRMFNPLHDGRIKVIAPDGTQRELHCRYTSGLEGNESSDAKGRYWQTVVLVFRAFDPFWYDTSTVVQTFTTGEPATLFPFFPIRLTSSTVFADTSIDNQGDVESWPEWIIKGPGEDITLRNFSTGETLRLFTSLQIGEFITIDTKPGKKTIKKNDGTNMYATLSDASSLWALQDGVNNIRIEMSNATTDSSVQLSYKPRYLGA
jgi:phage-related protein